MRTTSIINLKGGVGKTITSVNLAYQLCQRGSRVLVIDCDKQGNTSRFFKAYDKEKNSLADILTGDATVADTVVRYCVTEDDKGLLDVIPANMSLIEAEKTLQNYTIKPPQIILRTALNKIRDCYDYCIIDCAPDVGFAVVNALAASNDVIIPVTIDKFTVDGIDEILERINELRGWYNPVIKFIGCLVTMYRNDNLHNTGIEMLKKKYGKVFETSINYTSMVGRSTFKDEPIMKYSPQCKAAKCYVKFTDEYIASGR